MVQVGAPLLLGPRVELNLHLTHLAKKQCDSLLHFCQGDVGGAQQEVEHTHSPCPHTTSQLVDSLLKKD